MKEDNEKNIKSFGGNTFIISHKGKIIGVWKKIINNVCEYYGIKK